MQKFVDSLRYPSLPDGMMKAWGQELPQKIEELKHDRCLPDGPPSRESALAYKGWKNIYGSKYPDRWKQVPKFYLARRHGNRRGRRASFLRRRRHRCHVGLGHEQHHQWRRR